MYLNKALIYGNLTRDPEVRALPSGQQVVTFGVATNRTYKNKEGQKQEATEFHNVVAFGRLAELIGQYMKKGRPIYIEGRLQTRSWESDGRKNYRTEIVADTFQFGADGGTGRGSAAGESGTASAPTKDAESAESIQYPDEDINPEDIPF
ncbi:MAG: single-stranded DNA-binding protein [Parcubacteria group bacterium 21-54-25]|nr:MAG: single-stranded DNA-binding protein [Parcubacteria group bacterium 21-54-25]HQU07511.1 single-stranded DNA-binding protein [Candidatus Paceibacterota bacterium]